MPKGNLNRLSRRHSGRLFYGHSERNPNNMTKSIATYLAEIEKLKAEVLDANQCAARALEGRDRMVKERQEIASLMASRPVPSGYIHTSEANNASQRAVKMADAISRRTIEQLRADVKLLKTKLEISRLKNNQND